MNLTEAWDRTLERWAGWAENPLTTQEHCGLCAYYQACTKCPINLAGYRGCDNTPVYQFFNATKMGNIEEARALAQDELDLLLCIRAQFSHMEESQE